MKNVGLAAITAAYFLERFVGETPDPHGYRRWRSSKDSAGAQGRHWLGRAAA